MPRFTALLNIRYATFDAALRDAGTLMKLQAASSETIDATVLALARQDAVWLKVQRVFSRRPRRARPKASTSSSSSPRTKPALAEQARARRGRARRRGCRPTGLHRGARRGRCRGDLVDAQEVGGPARQHAGRAAARCRSSKTPSSRPRTSPTTSAEFRAALDRRGLVYGMFGHVDAGCLHVRPALDMKDPAQEKLVREISDEVFELTRKYKGVLWGEHGKGLRSEYVPEFFGPLYPRMQEIKAAFDPHNQLNPGKIAAPPGHELTRLDGVPTRGQFDRQIPHRHPARERGLAALQRQRGLLQLRPRRRDVSVVEGDARSQALAQGPRVADARVAAAAGRRRTWIRATIARPARAGWATCRCPAR